MRNYGKVGPRFWTAGTGRNLRGQPDAQVVALYLMSCPASNLIGLFTVARPTMAHETGLPEGRVGVALALLQAEGFAFFDETTDLVWVVTMAAHQIADTVSVRDKRHSAILRELAAHKGHPFVGRFWDRYGEAFQLGDKPLRGPLEGPPKAPRSQDQDQDQDQKQKQEEEQAPSASHATAPLEPERNAAQSPEAGAAVSKAREIAARIDAEVNRRTSGHPRAHSAADLAALAAELVRIGRGQWSYAHEAATLFADTDAKPNGFSYRATGWALRYYVEDIDQLVDLARRRASTYPDLTAGSSTADPWDRPSYPTFDPAKVFPK